MGEEQAQRITKDTIAFMRRLLEAGCPIGFVLEQGFKYAMLSLWEDDKVGASIQGLYASEGYEIEMNKTAYMDNAAIVLMEASKTLELTLAHQREEG